MNRERNSSIEMFRILAMFLVLLVHMNGWFLQLGHSNCNDCQSTVNQHLIGGGKWLHEYVQSLACVCVNCFIIISGYYGIKLKATSLLRIFFTVVCVTVPFAAVIYLIEPSMAGIKNIFYAFHGLSGHGYFIQCYLMLVFLSPVLNSFVDKYGRNILRYVIVFVLIEGYLTLRDCDYVGFENGYRALHFIMLYLVARCLFLYRDELSKVCDRWYMAAYFGGALLMSAIYLSGFTRIYGYANPLNIVMSIALFIPFTKRTFHNRFINWLASGTFTAYIINTCSPAMDLYIKLDCWAFDNHNIVVFYLIAICVIVVMFILSVLYDSLLKRATAPLFSVAANFIKNRFPHSII